MKLFLVAFLLAACAEGAAPSSWDSCGTATDRLVTKELSLTGSPEWHKGVDATVDATGACSLHGPLQGGSYSIEIYELGFSHPVSTQTGDLLKILRFTDNRNTTFELKAPLLMPQSRGSGKFQASFMGKDFEHAPYYCLDIFFNYTKA